MNDIGGEKWRNVERKFCYNFVASCSNHFSNWHTDHFLLYGVGIVTYLHIPLPGSVIGLLLLVLSLIFKIIKVDIFKMAQVF